MALVGETISLNLTVTDDLGTRYPRAFLYDEQEVPLSPAYVDLVYVSNGMYAGEFTMPDSPLVTVVYSVYTDSGHTTLDTGYNQATEVFYREGRPPTIAPPSPKYGSVPFVGDALFDWFQPMVFEMVTKTVRNFQVYETGEEISFMGVWQPLQAFQLYLKPEGQRTWSWYLCHSDPTLNLNTDEIISYLGVHYRVMAKKDYKLYGYMEYELVEDWTGSDPVTS